MKAEKYLMDHIMQSGISMSQVKKDLGIDMEGLFKNNGELMADEFMRLCIYLGVNPDDVMNSIV